MWLYVGIAILVIGGVAIFRLRALSEKSIVLLGAPGSGKGTQAEMITRHFGIPVTSPGTILRRERDLGTPLGIETADEISKQGGLVPDEIIVRADRRLAALHGGDGFVFDGFPRTMPQAERLNEILQKRRTAARSGDLAGCFRSRPCAIGSRAGCNARRCGFTTSLSERRLR